MKYLIVSFILNFTIANGLLHSKTNLNSVFYERIGSIQNWRTYQNDKGETQCSKQWNHYLNILKEGSYFPNSTWALKSEMHCYLVLILISSLMYTYSA